MARGKVIVHIAQRLALLEYGGTTDELQWIEENGRTAHLKYCVF